MSETTDLKSFNDFEDFKKFAITEILIKVYT